MWLEDGRPLAGKKEKGNEERIEEGKMRQGSKCVNKGRGKASIQGQEKRKGMKAEEERKGKEERREEERRGRKEK